MVIAITSPGTIGPSPRRTTTLRKNSTNGADAPSSSSVRPASPSKVPRSSQRGPSANQVRLTEMAPCTEGEIVVERNGKRYSIVYRFVDDNEARPHTIAGSYAGTVEFTNLVRDAGSSPL